VFRKNKKTSKKSCLIKIQQEEIPFLLKKSSHRKTVAITIDEKAEISVAAPFYTTDKAVYSFIHEKGDWILAKLREAQKNKVFLDQKQFEHGKEFLFLGKKHKLNIIVDEGIKRAKITFDAMGWKVSIPPGLTKEQREKTVKSKMMQWYRLQAHEVLGGRLFHYGRLLGKEPKKIVVKTQKRMWGCCDFNTQTIYLNWQIILSPMMVADYVVVHELCHLFEPNHSRRFWNKVTSVMPDYKERKKWLKNNYFEMVLP